MISLASWWWPKRPVRVPRARTAGLVAGLGAALFGVSALLLKTQRAACVSFTRGQQRADVARPCRALHRAQASYN
jgi:hypothetical protein